MANKGGVSGRAGARRAVLRSLKDIKSIIGVLDAWWSVSGRTYEGTTYGSGTMRDRQPKEYPENQRRYWASTIQLLDQMSKHLEMLRKYCLEQHEATSEDEPK